MNEETKKDQETEDQKLVLSTQKSIHKPIEIEIDGKTYFCRPLSRATFDEVKKHEKAALKGDITALYEQVKALYGVPIAVLEKIDIRDINSVITHTMKKVFQTVPTTAKEKEEKNAPKPGQEELALSPANSQAS